MTDEETQQPSFEPGSNIEPALPPARKRSAPAVIALAIAVTLAAAGTVYALRSGGSDGPSLDKLVPANSIAFASVTIKPSGSQARALRDILGRLPASARESLGNEIDDGLSELFAELDLDYARDVKPWVGAELGVVVHEFSPAMFMGGTPPVVGLIEVRDEAAARDALRRAVSADDETPVAFEILDGVAYVAPTAAAIDRVQKGAAAPLSADPDYAAARASMGDALAVVWFDTTGVTIPTGIVGTGDPEAQKVKGAMALRATHAGIEVIGEQVAGKPSESRSGAPALLESAPSSILGGLTLFDIGTQVASALDGLETSGAAAFLPFDLEQPLADLGLDLREDVLSWMHGETSVIVGGFGVGGPELALLIEPTRPEVAARTLRKVATALEDEGLPTDPTADGFDVAGLPVAVGVRQGPDRVVIATPSRLADQLLTAAPASLDADAVYRRAVGSDTSGTQMQLFIRLDRIRLLAEGFMPAEVRAEYDRDVAPVLELFESFSVRATSTPGGSSFRALLALAP